VVCSNGQIDYTQPRQTIPVPRDDDIERVAARFGFTVDAADVSAFAALMADSLESFRFVDEMADGLPTPRPRRDPGRAPTPRENPLNAWYWRCSIREREDGPLAGKRVVAKDNICVAGIPMMNGSRALEGYVPEFDATVVRRVLDAGGEIVGKATCEHLSFGGSSFTADTGPVHNPFDPRRSTGGSSSGAAALVAGGDCDVALAADQGGSIRVPAAWCGLFGLKPTYGLVPYTGIFPSELTLDHSGTLARTATDTALLLEVIAGADPLDPRQRDIRVNRYVEELERPVNGLRIGLLSEGFGWPALSEPDVDGVVRQAALTLSALGCDVTEVNVPMHRDGMHVWRVIGAEGRTATMIEGNGAGTNWKGFYPVSMMEAFWRGRRRFPNSFSDLVKLTALLGGYIHDRSGGVYYGKAQNAARVLSSAYDTALESVDLLVLPTTPMKPMLLPGQDEALHERVRQSFVMAQNTAPFDVTGHPALNVPCGTSDGLPVGLMLVGRRWEDSVLLRVGHALEGLGGYRPPSLAGQGVAEAERIGTNEAGVIEGDLR
jgi:amidase